MSIPDTLAELTDMLLADTAVIALADENVFGGELPTELNVSMPVAAVVLSPAGGPGRRRALKLRRTRIDTTCYGPTLEAAWALHAVVREALENAARTATLLDIETSSDGALARDPVTQWPTCYASYIVLAAIDP